MKVYGYGEQHSGDCDGTAAKCDHSSHHLDSDGYNADHIDVLGLAGDVCTHMDAARVPEAQQEALLTRTLACHKAAMLKGYCYFDARIIAERKLCAHLGLRCRY